MGSMCCDGHYQSFELLGSESLSRGGVYHGLLDSCCTWADQPYDPSSELLTYASHLWDMPMKTEPMSAHARADEETSTQSVLWYLIQTSSWTPKHVFFARGLDKTVWHVPHLCSVARYKQLCASVDRTLLSASSSPRP